jgi:integrase
MFLTKDQIARLYKDTNLQEEMALIIGLNTGISLQEMLRIKKSDINMEQRSILIQGTRGIRRVYLSSEAMSRLEIILTRLNGSVDRLFNYSDRTWEDALKDKWSAKAGFDMKWRNIRSSYAHYSALSGCPIGLVAQNMGVSEQQIADHFRLDDLQITSILKNKVIA